MSTWFGNPTWFTKKELFELPKFEFKLPTTMAVPKKDIKVLIQELQYDLEREKDIEKQADLIMRCTRYIKMQPRINCDSDYLGKQAKERIRKLAGIKDD